MAVAMMLAACEKPIIEAENEGMDGNVVLTFEPTVRDRAAMQSRQTEREKTEQEAKKRMTRADAAQYFEKLNVQLFDENGVKVFEKVKTQTATDEDFCKMSLKLTDGTYTVVAVGHSSKNSATIKSPEVVQFTASEGEKLTDTFCHCSTINVGGKTTDHTLPMYRVGAMIQFCLTDTKVPENFAYFLMEYSGGSANFNPTTLQGITKSNQSEKRIRNQVNVHQAYTFPYMATSCKLKMTVSGLDSEGVVIRKRVFEDVPVTRNKITTYTGKFFEDGDGKFTLSDFGFVVHTDWDGEEDYQF